MSRVLHTTLLSALLAACTTTPVAETTTGTQPTAPVTSISAEVPQTITSVTAQLGATYPASVTPPAPDSHGTINPLTPSSFRLPLPATMDDTQLSRFYDLFTSGCKMNVTGNIYARLRLLSTLDAPGSALVSVAETTTNGVRDARIQVLYLYADRSTYLRGTASCAQPYGFELNLTRGWNRVTRLDLATTGVTLYATTPRDTGTRTTPELWR